MTLFQYSKPLPYLELVASVAQTEAHSQSVGLVHRYIYPIHDLLEFMNELVLWKDI